MADGGLQKKENYEVFSTSGSIESEENWHERNLQAAAADHTQPACWADDSGLPIAAIRTTKEFNQGSDMTEFF